MLASQCINSTSILFLFVRNYACFCCTTCSFHYRAEFERTASVCTEGVENSESHWGQGFHVSILPLVLESHSSMNSGFLIAKCWQLSLTSQLLWWSNERIILNILGIKDHCTNNGSNCNAWGSPLLPWKINELHD